MGNKIGVIFYGTEGVLVQREYTYCIAFDRKGDTIKEFKGGGDHFANFIQAIRSRKAETLNSDAFQGHLSASLAHLANISYYLGEKNKVTVARAKTVLEKIKSLDDNVATLNRTVQHLKDNGVDLDATAMSMGPLLQFDPQKEVFTNSAEANKILHRQYRDPFICPTADKV
jgi:predicted transcriptional regulator